MHDLVASGRIFLYFAIAFVILGLGMIFIEKRKTAPQVIYDVAPLFVISLLSWVVTARYITNSNLVVLMYAAWFAFYYLVMRPLMKRYL